MLILGIETSCDETSAAVVRDGRRILSNVVSSSLEDHRKFGGIIPEIASRRQMELIYPVVDEALSRAGVSLKKISAIAVTQTPGLIGSLLVGVAYARGLAFAMNKPLIEVDHIKAHIYANFLTEGGPASRASVPELPAVGLIVSGGHTSLYALRDYTRFQLLGETRDDAAGEAFDKVARLLNLGYPGGPVIDRMARDTDDPAPGIRFTAAELPGTFDFSFSGVKTAVLYYQQKHAGEKGYAVAPVVRAFQDSVVGILVRKALAACRKKKARSLLVGGGVAANSALRRELTLAGEAEGVKAFFPPMSLCVDNAAMIAGLGYHLAAAVK